MSPLFLESEKSATDIADFSVTYLITIILFCCNRWISIDCNSLGKSISFICERYSNLCYIQCCICSKSFGLKCIIIRSINLNSWSTIIISISCSFNAYNLNWSIIFIVSYSIIRVINKICKCIFNCSTNIYCITSEGNLYNILFVFDCERLLDSFLYIVIPTICFSGR